MSPDKIEEVVEKQDERKLIAKIKNINELKFLEAQPKTKWYKFKNYAEKRMAELKKYYKPELDNESTTLASTQLEKTTRNYGKDDADKDRKARIYTELNLEAKIEAQRELILLQREKEQWLSDEKTKNKKFKQGERLESLKNLCSAQEQSYFIANPNEPKYSELQNANEMVKLFEKLNPGKPLPKTTLIESKNSIEDIHKNYKTMLEQKRSTGEDEGYEEPKIVEEQTPDGEVKKLLKLTFPDDKSAKEFLLEQAKKGYSFKAEDEFQNKYRSDGNGNLYINDRLHQPPSKAPQSPPLSAIADSNGKDPGPFMISSSSGEPAKNGPRSSNNLIPNASIDEFVADDEEKVQEDIRNQSQSSHKQH